MGKMRILITDGFNLKGMLLLEEAGFEVVEKNLSVEQLSMELPGYDGIIVRSATKLKRDLLEKCTRLKFIGRGGVGLDNIDTDFAAESGIPVFNTPAASSRSVAELVFGHILSITRGLNQVNREMPILGHTEFNQLKKRYAKGAELYGKTLGIIGLGRIGTESARIGLGMGMRVIGHDPHVSEKKIGLDINGQQVYSTIHSVSTKELFEKSDVITLHVPNQDEPVIGFGEIDQMKDGVIIVNASRGGLIDESALLQGLDNGKITGAGLDVFYGEPNPSERILQHPLVSMSPHIGASTFEAQEKIGIELARKIIQLREELVA